MFVNIVHVPFGLVNFGPVAARAFKNFEEIGAAKLALKITVKIGKTLGLDVESNSVSCLCLFIRN